MCVFIDLIVVVKVGETYLPQKFAAERVHLPLMAVSIGTDFWEAAVSGVSSKHQRSHQRSSYIVDWCV